MLNQETNNNLTAGSFFGKNKIASPSQVNDINFKEELRRQVLEQYLNLASNQMGESTLVILPKKPIWKRPTFLFTGLAILVLVTITIVVAALRPNQLRETAVLKGEVAYTEGTVLYKTLDGEWQKASANLLMEQGMTLKVDGNGKSIISLDDGSSVRLNSDSQVTLTSMDPKHIVIANDQGEVYTRVAQADRKFDVLIKGITYQAMGTAYKTLCLEDRQGVEVYESKVKILGISDNNEVLVQQGEKFYIVNLTDPNSENKVIQVDLNDLKQDDFVLWNKSQDEKIEEFRAKLGILFDVNAPFINIASPLISSTKDATVTVSGQTEGTAKVYVNDLEIINNSNGYFTYEFALAIGENIIKLKSIDPIGNFTIKTIYITRLAPDATPIPTPTKAPASNGGNQTNNSPSITLTGSNNGNGIQLNWTIKNTDAPNGFKIIRADHANPIYPGNDYQYLNDSGVRSYNWNITDGATWHFRVCKYNGSGTCLLYSNDITVTAPLVVPTTEPIPTVTISLSASGSNTVSWTVTGNSPHGFKVVWSKSHNPTYPAPNYQYLSNPGDRNSNAMGALDGYGTYYVRVCAYDGVGACYSGLYSNEVTLTLGTPPATATPTPTPTPIVTVTTMP